MINSKGLRLNVGIVILNQSSKVFWGKRIGKTSWQFPQGGINPEEQPIDALYRELKEEVGLSPHDVELVATSKNWYKYMIPKHLLRQNNVDNCIGQKQKWFLLRLKDDAVLNLGLSNNPEFDSYRWVNYWFPLNYKTGIINFKRKVYCEVLSEFSEIVNGKNKNLSLDPIGTAKN